MAYTIEQHNLLEEAISQGVLEVEYSDKKVKYRSLDDMLRTLTLMKNQLGLIKANSGRKYAQFSSGFNTSETNNL